MTAEEYLRAKNDLVKKYTGKVLVYEEDIVPHNVLISEFQPSYSLSWINCTYCINAEEGADTNCSVCPIYQHGRGCLEESCEKTSPYEIATASVKELSPSLYDSFSEELLNLGKELKENYTPIEDPEFSYDKPYKEKQ